MKILDGFLPMDTKTMGGISAKFTQSEEEYKVFGMFGDFFTGQIIQTEEVPEESLNLKIDQKDLGAILDGMIATISNEIPEIDTSKIKAFLNKNLQETVSIPNLVEELKIMLNDTDVLGQWQLGEDEIQELALLTSTIQEDDSAKQPKQLFFRNSFYVVETDLTKDITSNNTKITDESGKHTGIHSLFYGKKNNLNLGSSTKGTELQLDDDVQVKENNLPPQSVTFDNILRVNMAGAGGTTSETVTPIHIKDLGDSILNIASKNISILQKGETTTGKIKLYPEELGQVTIHLEMHKGDLMVRIVASNEAAYNHLQQSSKDLVQKFIEEGTYSEVSVDLNMGNTGQDSSRDQGFQKHYSFPSETQGKQPTEEEINYFYEVNKGNYNYKI